MGATSIASLRRVGCDAMLSGLERLWRMSRSPGARIRDNKYQLPKTNNHQDSLLLRFRCSYISRQMLISISKPQMETLADLAQQYLKFPSDTAFVGHRGYRTIRRTYRQTAEMAFRFARH